MSSEGQANLVLEIAQYCRRTSFLPNKRIALAVGLAAVAGVAARRYHISRSGLNLYILIVGKTGFGKSSGVESLDRVYTAAGDGVMTAHRGPSHLMSGHALACCLADSPCIVSHFGEFGYRLRDLSNARKQNSADSLLLQLLIDNFHKSGPGQETGVIRYRDEAKTLDSVRSPAMTILADTTNEVLSDAITKQTVMSGLFPRFSIFRLPDSEFEVGAWNDDGDSDAAFAPERFDEIVTRIRALAEANRTNPEQRIKIDVIPEAKKVLDEYRLYCQCVQRDTDADMIAAMVNRCHMKALRYAGLMAVGCLSAEEISDGIAPIVDEQTAMHAVALEKDLWKHNRLETEDTNEAAEDDRMKLILAFVKSWLSGHGDNTLRKPHRPYAQFLREKKMIPWEALYHKFSQSRAFDRDVMGRKQASLVIAGTVEAMERLGYLTSISGETLDSVKALTEQDWRQKIYSVENTDYISVDKIVSSIYDAGDE